MLRRRLSTPFPCVGDLERSDCSLTTTSVIRTTTELAWRGFRHAGGNPTHGVLTTAKGCLWIVSETMTERTDWNRRVIEEFRANGGKVGGMFEGMPLLLLHHVGAKTGAERVSPVAYQRVGDAVAVFASKGGAPTNPDWFHNVVANPDVTVEIGTDSYPARARIAT